MIDFGDKVVLVIGGGAGIGRATVSAFAEHGATVVALEVDETRADELRTAGANVAVIHGDATDAVDVSSLWPHGSREPSCTPTVAPWPPPVGIATTGVRGRTCR